MRFFTNNKIAIIFLIFFQLIVFHNWVFSNTYFTYGDAGIYTLATQSEFTTNAVSIFLSNSDFGSINLSASNAPFLYLFGVLSKLGISYVWSAKLLIFLPIILLVVISSYLFVQQFTKNYFGAIFGALFYSYNPYFLICLTQQLYIALAYALSPLVLLYFVRLLDDEYSFRNSIIYAFLLACLGFVEFRILYINLIIAFLYFIFYIFCNSKISYNYLVNSVKKLLPSFVILIFLNLFWLLPIVNLHSLTSNSLFSRGLFGNQYFDFINALTIFHPWWTSGPPSVFVKHDAFNLYFLIPITIVITIFTSKRKFKRVLPFFGLYLIGVLLTKQSALPFSNLYLFFYNNLPGFNAFREASKFFLVTAIPVSVILGIFCAQIQSVINRNLKILLYGLVTCLCFIFFTNAYLVFSESLKTTFIPRQFPISYVDINNFIDNQSDFFRTYWFPYKPRFASYSLMHPATSPSSYMLLNTFYFDSELTGQQNFAQYLYSPFNLVAFHNVLDISSIKYVVIPVDDASSGDSFFYDYGSKFGVNLEDEYKKQLDTVPWLKKVSDKNLTIYENLSYLEPIHSFTQLYSLAAADSLDKKYNFITNTLGGEFYFISRDILAPLSDTTHSTNISQPFEKLQPTSVKADTHTISTTTGQALVASTLYTDSDAKDVFADFEGNKITFYREKSNYLSLDGVAFTHASTSGRMVIATVNVEPFGEYYISNGSRVVTLTRGQATRLGENIDATLKLYSAGDNVIADGSFESGPWASSVGDCNNDSDNGLIGMSIDTANKIDGAQSLELDATRHVACTNQQVFVTGGAYILSLNYQGQDAKNAGFYVGFDDSQQTVISTHLPITNDGWQSYFKKIQVPSDASSAKFYLYSYATDNRTKAVTRYDDIRLMPLRLVSVVSVPPSYIINATPLSTKNESNSWQYSDPNYPLLNAIPDPSFENGLWGATVGDCNNSDANGLISMALSSQATDGKNSLELDATRHIACTGESAKVRGGGIYELSFDYQTGPKTSDASFNVGFDSTSTDSISETLSPRNHDWNHFSKTIYVPTAASSLSLTFYARESDGTTNNIDRYDNVSLVEIPDIANEYYVVSDPGLKLRDPASVTFDLLNPTKKLVHIKGATTPFYLSFSESYHPQWKLELNNQKSQILNQNQGPSLTETEPNQPNQLNQGPALIQGRSLLGLASRSLAPLAAAFTGPWATPDQVSDAEHYNLDDFLNAWYVDPAKLCLAPEIIDTSREDVREGCVQNADGSWDIEMVIEFWPQRWFYFGLIISGATLLSCLGYLLGVGVWALRRKLTRKSKRHENSHV